MIKNSLVFIAIIFLVSCSRQVNHFAYQDVKNHRLDNKHEEVDSTVIKMILPYKTSLDIKMNEVIGYNQSEMVKARPSSSLTNWVCDAIKISYEKKSGQSLDAVLQNYGGIRINSVAAGDITVGKIYEIMPFENNFVVLECDYNVVNQLFQKIALSGGWPISSNSSMIIKDSMATEIVLNGHLIEPGKTYKLGLPDYVANGGDECHFLKNVKRQDTGILIRDMLISYVKEQKSITALNDKRIKVLK